MSTSTFLNTAALARQLGVAEKTIRRQTRENGLPAHRWLSLWAVAASWWSTATPRPSARSSCETWGLTRTHRPP